MEESHFSCLRLACSRLSPSGDEQKKEKNGKKRDEGCLSVCPSPPPMSSFLLFRASLSSGLTEQTQLPVAVRVMSPRSSFFSGRTERVAENESTSLRARTGYKGYRSGLERKALKRVWKWSVRLRRNFYPHAKHTREARTVPDLRVSSDLAKKKRESFIWVSMDLARKY